MKPKEQNLLIQILNWAVDVTMFCLAGIFAIILIAAWFTTQGISNIVTAARNKPTIEERIETLEGKVESLERDGRIFFDNQKTFADQQGRILNILEHKAIKRAVAANQKRQAGLGWPRDRFGRFKKGGRR